MNDPNTSSEAENKGLEPAAGEIQEQQDKPQARSADPADAHELDAQGTQRPQDPEDADDVMTRRQPGHERADAEVLAASRSHTRRAFVVAAASTAAGYGFYEWLSLGPRDKMQPVALERAYEFNAAIARNNTLELNLAPTYPLRRAETLRVNGVVGLMKMLEPDSYRLQLVGMSNAQAHPKFTNDVTAWRYRYSGKTDMEDEGHDTKTPPLAAGPTPAGRSQAAGGVAGKAEYKRAPKMNPKMDTALNMAPESMIQKAEDHQNRSLENDQEDDNHTGRAPRGKGEAGESDSTLLPGTPGVLLTMDDITKLPRNELVTQFKCVEGWSQVVHWAGVRMTDFLEAYPPALIDGKEPRYVYMETPDGDYYVGYDMYVCRHPQTLLVTEMMGAPLTQNHGAPLRIHMPTKYGYKQIKRIGLICYTNEKPDDYWTKLGYDWYAGL